MPQIRQAHGANPQEDRLAHLAAIAQIYNSFAQPQFQRDELASREDRSRQDAALTLLGLQQQQQFHQGELGNQNAARTEDARYHDAAIKSENDRTAEVVGARKDASAARDRESQATAALQYYRDYNMANPMATAAQKSMVNKATMSQVPGLHDAYQQEEQNLATADAPGAQVAWNNISGVPGAAGDAAWQMFNTQHAPAVGAGMVDYSKVLPPTQHSTTAPTFDMSQVPTDLLPQVQAAQQYSQRPDPSNVVPPEVQMDNRKRQIILEYINKNNPRQQQPEGMFYGGKL